MINGGIYAAEVLPIKVWNVNGKMGSSTAVGTYPCSCGLVTRLVGGARRAGMWGKPNMDDRR
jgi:hypothetical protein